MGKNVQRRSAWNVLAGTASRILGRLARAWDEYAPRWLKTAFALGRIVSGYRGVLWLWGLAGISGLAVMTAVWEWFLGLHLVLQVGYVVSVSLVAFGIVGHGSFLVRRWWVRRAAAAEEPMGLTVVEATTGVVIVVENRDETADVVVEITAIRGEYYGGIHLPIRLIWQTSGSDVAKIPKGKSATVTVGHPSFRKREIEGSEGEQYEVAIFTVVTPSGEKRITQWIKFATEGHGAGHLWEMEVTATRLMDGASSSIRFASAHRVYAGGGEVWETKADLPFFDFYQNEARHWGWNRGAGKWMTPKGPLQSTLGSEM